MSSASSMSVADADLYAEIERLKKENEDLKSNSTFKEDQLQKLKTEVNRLENRFGLVWPHQKEHFLKVISDSEIVYKNKLWSKAGQVTSSKGKNAEVVFDDGKTIRLIRGNEPYLYAQKDSVVDYLCHGGCAYTLFKDIVGKYLPTLVPKSGGDKEWGFDDKNGERKHVLIEGDNYHALQVLQHTHRGAVDVIYIDPPYNTGNKDFKYNDRFVSDEDGSRHSSWLSFMERRLMLAKELLSKKGILVVSINEKEQANLDLLLKNIFGEGNIMGCLPTIMNMKGNQNGGDFAGCHEFTFFVSSSKNSKVNALKVKDSKEISKWSFDDKGFFKKGRSILSSNHPSRESRPFLYFPVLIKDESIKLIRPEEYKKIYDKDTGLFDDEFVNSLKIKYVEQGYEFLLPISPNGTPLLWDWGFDGKFKKNMEDVLISRNEKGKAALFKKQRPDNGSFPSVKQKTLLYAPEYSSGNGSNEIKAIFSEKINITPKPLSLIKDLILLTTGRFGTILDFFAGSGTTGHAVWELNKEDGGNRQVILCTNNESNICEDVTYERMRRCNLPQHGDYQEGLEYLQVRHVSAEEFRNADRNKSLDHIKHIINLRHNATKVIEDNDKWYITNTICVLKNPRYVDEFFEKFGEQSAFALVDNKSTKFQIFKDRAASFGIMPDKLYWLSKEYISDLLLSASVED